MSSTVPVRTVLCTSGGAYGAIALHRLLGSVRVQVVGLVQSTRVLDARFGVARGAWEQCRRSGVRYALYLGCVAAPSIRARAQARGIPVLRTREVNDPEGRAFVARCAPALLVSAFFNQRIDAAVAAGCSAGAVNIHPSLLPAFRGVDPVFHGRLRGAAEYGATVHWIEPELDAGRVIAQQSLDVSPGESVLRTTARLFDCGARLLLASLDAIVARDPGTPQSGNASYDSWPSSLQVAQLRRSGTTLISVRDALDLAMGRLIS